MDWPYLIAFALLASWALAFGLGWFVRRGQGPREDDTQRVTFDQLKAMPLPDFGPHELGAKPPDGWRYSVAQEGSWTVTTVHLTEAEKQALSVPKDAFDKMVADDWQRIVTGGKS